MISSKPHTTISVVKLINTASQNLSIVRPLCLFANETSLSHRKFLDLDKREEKARLDSLKPGRHVHAEHHDRDDLKRVRGAPGRTNLGTLDVRDIDLDAGIRSVFLGIDGAYCELRVFVQELREPLDLLLRVADRDGARLDLIGMRGRTHEQEQRSEAKGGLHDTLLNG